MDQESSQALATAIETEQAENMAAVVAVEEREPAPEVGAERERSRTEDGRFAPSRPLDENGLRNRIDIEQLKNARLISDALEDGLVIPDDSMSPELWAKAFKGRMAQAERDGGHSTTPPPAESRTSEESAEPEPASQPDQGGPDEAVVALYNERAQAFVQEHPDFSEVVGELALPPHVAQGVELAILAETNGPEIAYELARSPQLVSDLGQMSPAQAVAQIGRLAERMESQRFVRDQASIDLAFGNVEVPPAVLQDFHRRSRALHAENPLTPEQIEMAESVQVAPHVSGLIVAMDQGAEVLHYLVRHPAKVSGLNRRDPLSAAAELAKIQLELADEVPLNPERRSSQPLPAPITPTRRSSATDHALSDSLGTEEWARRFKRKMGYSGD